MLNLRQRWRIRIARMQRWEFWPTWLFYLPIIVWIFMLGLRHRHFTAFSAANPGMDEGGVVGERKSPLLLALRKRLPDATPPLCLLPAGLAPEQRIDQALKFARGTYPVVLKPEIGQRGRGVLIARSAGQLRDYLQHADFDVIVQAFVAGKEFGAFVYREPATDSIRIYSLTAKELMHVHGDGQRNLAELIMAHPRAWLMAPSLFRTHAGQLHRVLDKGAEFYLVEVGSHCRGAVFLNAQKLITPALERRLGEIVAALPDFHFGRLDLIATDRRALREGRELQILEVNGVSAEAAHVYHPGTPLLTGYRSFFRQWQLAFEIGAHNRRHGAIAVSPWRLLQLFLEDLGRFDEAERAVKAARATS